MTEQTLYAAPTYTDAPAAIAWLERSLGLVPEHVYPGDGGTIAHAQLRAGRDLAMLGSARASGPAGRRSSPAALGGAGTIALYLRVDDIEARYARVMAAHAKIVRPLGATTHDDSTTFTIEDCEGYVWAIGTYAASPGNDLAPCLRYDDAPRAIAWLRDACGFTERLVVPGENGTISHAEMQLGASVLMLGSRRDDGLRLDTPARAGGTTGSVYAYVADPDELFARMRATATDVVSAPDDKKEYPSREFAVRDPEGNAFTFGTYRP